MALYEDMQELIGNTPLVRLNHLDLPDDVRLYAKLELFKRHGIGNGLADFFRFRPCPKHTALTGSIDDFRPQRFQ